MLRDANLRIYAPLARTLAALLTLAALVAVPAACEPGGEPSGPASSGELPTPAPECGPDELLVDGDCLPAPGAPSDEGSCAEGHELVEGLCQPRRPAVGALSLRALDVSPAAGADMARVHYPVRVSLGLAGDAPEPTEVHVLVGLRAADAEEGCLLGLVPVLLDGDGESRGSATFYVGPECLHGDRGHGEPSLLRDLHVAVRIDPYDEVRQPAENEAYHADGLLLASGEPAGPPPAVHCATAAGDRCERPVSVGTSAGLDIELRRFEPLSSVVFLRRCVPSDDPDTPNACTDRTGDYLDGSEDLAARIELRAHGVPNVDENQHEVDVLAEDPLRLAFAIRPEGDENGWRPLWVHPKTPSQPFTRSESVSYLVPRRPKHGLVDLHFSDRCEPDCDNETVRSLLLDGAWRDEMVFEVRACLEAEAEAAGRDANNCATNRVIIVREGQHVNPLALRSVVSIPDCPARQEGDPPSVCFVAPPTNHPILDVNKGSASDIWAGLYFDIKGRMDSTMAAMHSEARATVAALGGAVLGDDEGDYYNADGTPKFDIFSCGGLNGETDQICIELAHVWAHAGVYADSDLYDADPNHVSCGGSAPFPDLGGDDPVATCQRSRTCKAKQRGSRAWRRCVNRCVAREKQAAQAEAEAAEENQTCVLLPRGTASCPPASTRPTGCDCDGDGRRDSGVYPMTFVNDTGQKCYSCGKRPEWSPGGDACFAYYSLGLEFFGRQIWGLEAAADRIGYEHPLSYAKRFEKSRTWLVGPIPINVGFAIEGELGVRLGLWLEGKLGSDRRALPDAACQGGHADLVQELCSDTPASEEGACSCTARLPEEWCAKGFVQDDGTFERVCEGPAHQGAGACWCDPACVYYGDCCVDYAWTCEMGMPPAPTVDLRVPEDPGARPICLSPECREHLEGTNLALALVFGVTPFANLSAEAWAGLDVVVARALIKGVVDIVQVDFPIEARLLFGLFGGGRAECGADGKCRVKPLSLFEGRLLAEIGARMDMFLLGGSLSVVLEHIDLEWCWFVPCGITYTEFWSYEILDLDRLLGQRIRAILFAKGTDPLVFPFLERNPEAQ